MRVSIGTAQLLGLKNLKTDATPTTAYLLHGEGCRNNCKFCAQARESGSDSRMLSRVIWPKYEITEIIDPLKNASDSGSLKRCCIQVVDDGQEDLLKREISILSETSLPICISKGVNSITEIKELLELGVDRVTIALDAVNPNAYQQIKGGSFEKRWNFLLEAATAFPDRISTHLIIGLGENENETISLIAELKKYKIHAALFAFTPLKGTPLENLPQPEEGKYRRIQLAQYLIMNANFRLKDFNFADSKLIGFEYANEEVLQLLENGEAFRTSGCPDCNRPYYNERPGGVIYNYPRPLTREETFSALKKSKLWSEKMLTDWPNVNNNDKLSKELAQG